MRLSPLLLPLLLALDAVGYGATQIDVYKAEDMEKAGDINTEYEMILHDHIDILLPNKKSNFYHSGVYVFSSAADVNTPSNLSFHGLGANDERGEVLHNCGATFDHLGNVSFTYWVNTWGGDDDDTSVSAHGGAISGGDGDVILFRDNKAILFSHITYDSSKWGANHSSIGVFGGAIHVYNSDAGSVDFAGNQSVTLQYISIINEHDTNYCYKDLYAYGGAIFTPRLNIRNTENVVSLSNNRIHQGVCKDVKGVGQGGAVHIADCLDISSTAGNVVLDSNSILVANRAEGGALYLAENSSGSLSDNLLHLQFRANTVQATADADFNWAEDSLHEDCEARGGAAYIGGTLLMERNSGNITIESNTATADYSMVLENGNSEEHDNDPAYALGGAFFLASGAHLGINRNGTETAVGMGNVTFSYNEVSTVGTSGGKALGGAIYLSSDASVEISHNNGNVSFSNNTATEGGAIYLSSDTSVEISHNTGNVSFSNNTATEGGAIYLSSDTSVKISHNNGNVSFSNNTATEGGAIYFTAGSTGSLSGNGSVSFENNSATRGASIYAAGAVSISGNGNILFSGNTAEAGSAIYATSGSKVDIGDNTGSVSFTNNKSDTGAIHMCSSAEFNLRNNAAVILEGGSDTDKCVLYGESGSTARISGNAGVSATGHEIVYSGLIRTAGALYLHGNTGAVELNNNSALQASGGVITLEGNSALLSLCGNSGSITATGNYAFKTGGVIRAGSGSHILICDNADVTITDNSSRAGAAAIDSDGSIHIRNNAGNVIFGKNGVYDEESNLTTWCSLRADSAQCSAAAGYSIEFRDSIHISPANAETPALILNADYKDSSGTTHKQGGDIIFTGADTINAEPSIDAAASRRSKIDGTTTLHNGRLIVTQQAVLEGASLNTTAQSGATVVLSQGGMLNQIDVTIDTGTSLQAGDADATILLADSPMLVETLHQLVENTTVCGYFGGSTLNLQSGSTYAMYGGILDLNGGSLHLSANAGSITLSSTIAPTLIDDEYVMLLFTGVNRLEYSEDILLSYNGREYGAEHLAYAADEHAVYLRNVVIPEPATTSLCFLALAALVSRRRR